MNDDWQKLVDDTISYIKAEGLIPEKKPQEAPIEPLPPKRPKPIPKPERPPPPQPQPAIPERKPQPLPSSDPIKGKIEKHLPHIRLIDEPPKQNRVAIIYESKDAIPFLTNLKNAIAQRFCPVDLTEKLDSKTYILILTQKDLGHSQQILLAPLSTYQENIEEKKMLWTQICQTLSPKSS